MLQKWSFSGMSCWSYSRCNVTQTSYVFHFSPQKYKNYLWLWNCSLANVRAGPPAFFLVSHIFILGISHGYHFVHYLSYSCVIDFELIRGNWGMLFLWSCFGFFSDLLNGRTKGSCSNFGRLSTPEKLQAIFHAFFNCGLLESHNLPILVNLDEFQFICQELGLLVCVAVLQHL